jgi:hypothetical protein
LRLTSRIFRRSFRPTKGWSFSAISWAASRGWSFCVDDRRLDYHARLELLLHRAPLALEAGPPQGQDRVALLGLGLEDVDEDRVADGELRLRFGVAAVQLAVADDAFGLGPDVDEDLVLVDPDDGPFDDVAMLEALDVRVLLREQLFHRRRLRTEIARRRRLLGLVLGRGRGICRVVGVERRLVGGLHRRRAVRGRRFAVTARVGHLVGRHGVIRRGGHGGGLFHGRFGGRGLASGLRHVGRCVCRLGGVSRGGFGVGGLVGDGGRCGGPVGGVVLVRGNRLGLDGPVLLLFGQRSGLSCGEVPRHDNGLGSAQAWSGTIRVVVRARWAAVRSFVRAWLDVSSAVCLLGPMESSTGVCTATIARPCPNYPTWRSSPTPSTPH